MMDEYDDCVSYDEAEFDQQLAKATLESTATHEAAHVVMRWLLGLPATEIILTSDASGFCAGGEGTIPSDSALLIALAGFAYEGGPAVDLAGADTADFRYARALLEESPHLRVRVLDGVPALASVEDAMRLWFDAAAEMLWPHCELIERLGDQLARDRRLSARRVAAIIREWNRGRGQ